MNLVKKIVSLAAWATLLCVSSSNQKPDSKDFTHFFPNASQTTYNHFLRSYSGEEGGVNEDVLNLYYCDSTSISLAEIHDANTTEGSRYFIPKNSLENNLIVKPVYENMKHSFSTIQELAPMKFADVPQDKQLLKLLMNSLEQIRNFSHVTYAKKLELSYEKITGYLRQKKVPDGVDNSKNNVPIERSIMGYAGVCRDAVSAAYPLLEYYGYNVSYAMGYLLAPDKQTGAWSTKARGHIWLEAVINKDTFQLDPHWYGDSFVPLQKRNSFQVEKFDEKYLVNDGGK